MIERARSVGGTLDAGPGEDGGFVVTAAFPAAGAAPDVPPDVPSGEKPVTPR
jgi:hypothetical protein